MMKRIVNAFVCFLFCTGTSYAQEFSAWGFTTSEADRLKAGSEVSPDCSYGLTESGQPSSQYGRIGAFRACFHIYGAWHGIYRNAPYSFIFNGETTGISSIEKSSDSTSIFDLQGRRLHAKPSRGVYMERGKKYLTK